MYTVNLISAIVATTLLFSISVYGVPVKISVYYETLCPDSVRFITQSLYPIFIAIGGYGNPYLQIDFSPYGKANTTLTDGSYGFVCQHGPDECEGNKMHACALKYLPPQLGADFVHCSMNSSYPPLAGPFCASSLGVNFTVVEKCLNDEGPYLLSLEGNRTHSLSPPLYFVPWIIYNDVFSQNYFDQSLTNFTGVLCSILGEQNNLAPICSGTAKSNYY